MIRNTNQEQLDFNDPNQRSLLNQKCRRMAGKKFAMGVGITMVVFELHLVTVYVSSRIRSRRLESYLGHM
jgi:hypothetical protein